MLDICQSNLCSLVLFIKIRSVVRLSGLLFWISYTPESFSPQTCCAGQGAPPDRRPFQAQGLVQWPGTGTAAYMRHPLYMQASVSANNQPHPAVTCLAVQPGNVAWYVTSRYSRYLRNQRGVSDCQSSYTKLLNARLDMKCT